MYLYKMKYFNLFLVAKMELIGLISTVKDMKLLKTFKYFITSIIILCFKKSII